MILEFISVKKNMEIAMESYRKKKALQSQKSYLEN